MSIFLGICGKCAEEVYGGPEDMFDTGPLVCGPCLAYRNTDGTYKECPICTPELHSSSVHQIRAYQMLAAQAEYWGTQPGPAKSERVGDGGKWSDARQRQMRRRG